jgi:hypothetical protein
MSNPAFQSYETIKTVQIENCNDLYEEVR